MAGQNGQLPTGLTFVPAVDFRGPAQIGIGVTDPLLGTGGLTGTGQVSMQFLPANNFSGQAAISITVNDNGNNPAPAAIGNGTVTINVTPVNQPPYIIKSIPTVVVTESSQSFTQTINLSQYIGDPDENNTPPEAPPALSVLSNSNPALVSASISGQIMTLTFSAYTNGSAQIEILATDSGTSNGVHPTIQVPMTVTVNPVTFPPVGNNSEYLYTPGVPLVVTAPGALSADVDHNGLQMTATLTQVPSNGQLTLRSDGSFTYTPDAGFNGRDSFTYRIDDGSGLSASATVFLDTPTSRWVDRMYTEVLGRTQPPGDSEVNYWVNQINAGESRLQVSVNFVQSAERRSQTIASLYEQYLGRAVDPSGLNYWLSVWANNNGPEQVQAGIIGSLEYYETAGGTPQAWVTKLYNNLLGRGAGPQEIAYWSNYIQTNSRAGVVLGFVTSDEYRGELLSGIPGNPAVPGWYEQFLHRPIDPSGLTYWVQQMDHGYPQEAILEGILASDEYFNRA